MNATRPEDDSVVVTFRATRGILRAMHDDLLAPRPLGTDAARMLIPVLRAAIAEHEAATKGGG
jgi:hypothetical protein